MNSKLGRVVMMLAAAALVGSAGVAYAEGPHGDGGGRFEGGRFGGGHAAAPAHYAGAPARAQIATPRYSGAERYAGGARFGAAPARGYSPPLVAAAPRYAAGQRYVGAEHGQWNRTAGAGHWNGDRRWDGDRGWVGAARYGDHDDWDHDRYWVGSYWGGGYWGGGYWPGVSYGVNFAWFLPVLPGVYATYWYDGIPYYYANDVYYTWDPAYDGYVATDPPPVAGSAAPAPGAGDQIFMYPNNGQSAEQQAEDRRACERWASDQVGNSGGVAPLCPSAILRRIFHGNTLP